MYKELSKGYSEGRGTFDPRNGWYKGEIGFFDFYIIPLAKKLKDCGVFGSAATEYLDHALEIRRRWEEEGEFGAVRGHHEGVVMRMNINNGNLSEDFVLRFELPWL